MTAQPQTPKESKAQELLGAMCLLVVFAVVSLVMETVGFQILP